MIYKPLLIAAMTLAAGCASMGDAHYADYAGPAVRQIQYSNLYNWQRTSDRSIVIWTRPKLAYLLTFSHDCSVLNGRVTIQIGDVAGIPGRLEAGTADVRVGNERCRVLAIQPIDLERMRRERHS